MAAGQQEVEVEREVEMEDGGSGDDSEGDGEGEMSGVEGHDPALQLLEAAGAGA